MKRLLLCLISLCVVQLAAQSIVSPEVSADRRVTFRFRAPTAREVFVLRDGAERLAMTRDDKGVWSATTDPLEPDIYSYAFQADGVNLLDPSNWFIKPNLLDPRSAVHVPGPASLAWEVADVARGAVHHHFYRSAAAGDDRDYFVYTPPGYDPRAKKLYPVLCLLHGFSDDASAWSAYGRANVILDNLIAQKRAKPMIVVMPLGYGTMEIVSRRTPGIRDPNLRQRSFERFRDALLKEVLPEVEKNYRVSAKRADRAIAGLSMGGAESLYVGLNALNTFSWIGAFSSGGMGEDLNASFPALSEKANAQLRLLWIACGKEDRLIESNRTFLEFLKSKGVKYTWTETGGAHTWMVWRRYLSAFAPLLFQ